MVKSETQVSPQFELPLEKKSPHNFKWTNHLSIVARDPADKSLRVEPKRCVQTIVVSNNINGLNTRIIWSMRRYDMHMNKAKLDETWQNS